MRTEPQKARNGPVWETKLKLAGHIACSHLHADAPIHIKEPSSV